jgi:hypothetical protein
MRQKISLAVAVLAASAAFAKPAPTMAPVITEATVLIRDASIASTFSLANVLDAILKPASASPAARESLLRTLLASYNGSSQPNPISGLDMPYPPRAEARLDPRQLLSTTTGMVPVGLFNRIDLAPKDGSDCGEYRIVFSDRDSQFLIIFEAKLANPGSGMRSCKPLAAAWQKIGAERDSATRLALLKTLYFTGLPGFGPVVKLGNYGGALGQIRTNSIRGGDGIWELREFRAERFGGITVFDHVPVNASPFAPLWSAAQPGETLLRASERVAFQQAFVARHFAELTEPERQIASFDPAGPAGAVKLQAYKIQVINRIGAVPDLRFNEFRSNSGNDATNPRNPQLGQVFTSAATITHDNGRRMVTAAHLRERASVMTCGGCHTQSSNKEVGQVMIGAVPTPIVWPESKGFTHIDFNRLSSNDPLFGISPALEKAFLPFRKDSVAAVLALSLANDPRATSMSRAQQADRRRIAVQAFALAKPDGDTPAARAEYSRAIADYRSADAQKPGYFQEYRLPH